MVVLSPFFCMYKYTVNLISSNYVTMFSYPGSTSLAAKLDFCKLIKKVPFPKSCHIYYVKNTVYINILIV